MNKAAGVLGEMGQGLVHGLGDVAHGIQGMANTAKRIAAPVGKMLAPAAGVIQRGATEHPGQFLMTAGLGVPILGTMQNPVKTPEYLARQYQGRQMAAATMREPMKLASSVLSQADFEASLAIYSHLEKTAARVPLDQRLLAEALQGARGVRSFGGHAAEEAVEGGARGGRNRIRELMGLVPKPEDAELSALQRQKLEAEIAKFRGETTHGAAKAGREQEAHEFSMNEGRAKAGREEEKAKREAEAHHSNMQRYTPVQLAKAGLGLGAAASITGLGINALEHGAGKIHEKVRGMSTDRRYNAMVQVDPALAQNPLSQRYFEILDRASPYLASEPYLAAAAVAQMTGATQMMGSDVPGVRPEILSNILRTEGERQKTRFPLNPQTQADLRNISMLG